MVLKSGQGSPLDSAFAIEAICRGVVPQQPPKIDVPASQKALAYSPKYSGPAGYIMRPPACSGQPALGMAEKRASGTAARICLMIRKIWFGPPEQLTPITAAPDSNSALATLTGLSPSRVRSSRVKVIEAITGRAG